MSDVATTSPSGTVGGEALSFEGGVEAIENLLSDDLEIDLDGAEGEKGSEVASDDDEPELSIDEDDDEDGEAADAETSAPELSDDTEIVLEGGEKISLAQLKRNNLFQRDYTRKTEELARQREAQDVEFNGRVAQASEQIQKQRDFILEYASQFLPQEPSIEMLSSDPLGYMEAKARYDQQIAGLSQLHEQRQDETQQLTAKQQQEMRNRFETETSKLHETLPKLKDPEKMKAFVAEAMDIGARIYGVPEEAVQSITDHRFVRILHDAVAYQKLLAKKASTQETVKAKPKLVSKTRMSIPDRKSRDATGRLQALKKSGSVNDAIKSIMDDL